MMFLNLSWRRFKYLISKRIPEIIRLFIISKNATFLKRLNYFKMLFNHKFIKSIIVNNYPYMLTLGTGPICNLSCKLCPTGQKRNGRSKGFLSKQVVESVIDQLGPYLYSIDLFNWGEPLLVENLFEYVRLFKKKKIFVTISSNLNILSENQCKEIVDSGLDLLLISLHGCSQETLEKYQNGSNFDNVISNVKKIVEYKRFKGVNHPILQWRFIVTRFNEKELIKAYQLSKEIGFDIFEHGPLSCDMGNELLWDSEKQFLNVKPFLPKNEKWSKYNYLKKEKKIIHNKCTWLWRLTTINWNGSISPCCGLWDEKYDFGNILESSFKEIWNGKKYQMARRIIKSKNPILIHNLICSICKINKAIMF